MILKVKNISEIGGTVKAPPSKSYSHRAVILASLAQGTSKLYDMLFSEELSKQDINKINQVAVDLLQKVKAKIAELDHWTDKQETKSVLKGGE